MCKALVVVTVLLGGCALRPGETRCSMIYGVMSCRSYVPDEDDERPAVQAATGFWCTNVSLDAGVCTQAAGSCEVFRQDFNAKNKGGPGTMAGVCYYQAAAFCADAGCFTQLDWCVAHERGAKRDGRACNARR